MRFQDTQQRLQKALDEIQRLGYTLREEWMEGSGGGCVLNGQKLFFSDTSLPLPERLDQALEFLEQMAEERPSSG